MRDYRITNDARDVKSIFEIFDTDRSGGVSYDEFLRVIVGEMNDFRREVCKQAFRKLDVGNNGVIDLDDIKRSYNALQHPDVLAGRRSEDQILCDFLDTFEAHFCLSHGLKSKDRHIDIKEWLYYYNNVSCNIDDDQYFALMIKNAYKL